MFMLDDKVIPLGSAWRHPVTGIKYPANWLDLSSEEERSAIGIIETPDPVPPAPSLEDSKAQAVSRIKAEASEILRPDDWRMQREMERALRKAGLLEGEALALADEREAIRQASDEAEAAVAAAESASEIKALPAVSLRPAPKFWVDR